MNYLKLNHYSTFMLLLVFLSGPEFIWSQKEIKEYYVRKTIRQDGLQCQFNVLDDDKRGVWFYQRHKRYHWFKSQQVMSTEGASAGVLLHGSYEAFYGNKQLAIRGRFNKGLKSGEWKFWYEDGSISRVERWSNGRQQGEQISYAQSGEVEEVRQMQRRGNKIYANDSLIESRGVKQHVRVYDDRHRLVSDEHFKHGILHGKVVHYEDGKRSEVLTYRDGELQPVKDRPERVRKEKAGDEEQVPFFQRIFRKKKQTDGEAQGGKEKKERPPKEDKVKKEGPEKEEKKRNKNQTKPE